MLPNSPLLIGRARYRAAPVAAAAGGPRSSSRSGGRSLSRRARRAVARRLLRHAGAAPEPDALEGAGRRVFILLANAWGMGGTIRTTHNLAGFLAAGHAVEIISVVRDADQPFFGSFPPGVRVSALDDRRPGHGPRGLRRLLYRVLSRRRSVLVHPGDRLARDFSLWTDLELVRRLRGQAGFVIATRPALNLLIARMPLPGLVKIGQEHMHLRNHARPLRRAMRRHYGKLDVLAVLTEADRARYDRMMRGRLRLVCIPNTVRELSGPPADLSSKQVFAAGRMRDQKGFDLLIPAFARIAGRRPDWQLRVCGEGPRRAHLEALIARHGMEGRIRLDPPAADIGAEMARASVFALPSRFEGFPLILLEAMSKGMAIVAYDCPTGPREVVEDHVNGLLVRPRRDVDAFAAALLELMEDEDLRRRCAAAAVETARSYRMEAIGPHWAGLLASLDAERRAAR